MPFHGRLRREREAAWHAQCVIAGHAPFSATAGGPPREDADALVGEAVVDSAIVHEALMVLACALSPRRPLIVHVTEALRSMSGLLQLRDDWIAHCNDAFQLAPGASDPVSDMSRRWVSGAQARSWCRFAEGRAALDEATGPLLRTQQELAAFCRRDARPRRARAA